MKKRKLDYNRTVDKSYRYMVAGLTVVVVAAIVTLIVFGYFLRNIYEPEEEIESTYSSHYMYIVDDKDSEFWEQVYEYASSQAALDGVYLEDIRKSLKANYSNEELLRVAINSSVDGILYAGASSDEAVELIDKAVDKGICVIVLNNDIDKSQRQCFVGISNYELGQMYASEILKMVDEETLSNTEISILASADMVEGATNLISLAIEDYLTENNPDGKLPDIQIIRIDAEDTFSVEEDIRNIFVHGKEVPDIVLCLEGVYTECVYQDIVDYNYVGECQVVGCFASDEILEAIEKGIIYSTISIDTQKMGEYAIKAIEEYNSIGYTNSFVPVSIEVVSKGKAAEIIAERENDEEGNRE